MNAAKDFYCSSIGGLFCEAHRRCCKVIKPKKNYIPYDRTWARVTAIPSYKTLKTFRLLTSFARA
jgi:hypothetical protein